MTPTKWFASLCLLGLLLAGAALILYKRPLAPAAVVQPHSQTSQAAPIPAAPSFKEGAPMKRVMDLYESESKRVGQVDKDPKGTQKRLEENARELSPQEIGWLEAQVVDRKNDADARFFAAYMMGLSHKAEAVEGLARVAVSPVPASKNPRLEEQERVLRSSAIEGMSLSCKDFPVAVKDGLTDVIARQTDESIRDRANRGLYACQFGKPMAEQDREALEKVRSR